MGWPEKGIAPFLLGSDNVDVTPAAPAVREEAQRCARLDQLPRQRGNAGQDREPDIEGDVRPRRIPQPHSHPRYLSVP